MKSDEKKFFRACYRFCRLRNTSRYTAILPRDVITILREFISAKRCFELLDKWAALGFYNYGSLIDLGWIEPDKLPEEYKQLLEAKK